MLEAIPTGMELPTPPGTSMSVKPGIRSHETLGLWIALALIVLVAALSVWESRRAAETARWVEHSHGVLESLSDLREEIARAHDAKRGFALTGDAASLGRYAPGRILAIASSLRAQTADNPRQQARLDRLEPLLAHRIARLDAAIAQRRAEGFDLPREAESVRESNAATAEIAAAVAAMAAEERALLVARERQTDRSAAYGNAVRLGGVLTSGLILLVAFAGLRREVARRVRSERAAHEAAAKLREAGRFLDSVFENIPDVILVKSAADLRIERINRAAEALLGRPREEVLDRTLADLGPADVAEHSRAMDREALAQRESLPAAEVQVETPGGRRWLRARRVPIPGDDGAPRHLLIVAEDITECRRLEEGLREMNAELERRVVERTAALVDANARLEKEAAERRRTAEALARSEEQFLQAQKMEAVGRLAGGVAHDFNNLLSVILGYCELMADDPQVEEGVRADVQEIARAGQRASDLTRQLLAFSRQQVLAPAVVELNEILADVEPMLVRLLGEDIELRFVSRPGLGKVLVDPGQLEQVILNLAVNARDAMPRGGTLTLETDDVELDAAYAAEHPEATPGPHVMLAVTDTGTGMDAATRARIFEPFFTTKEKGKGTGLGLSTVFGIVRQSGGTVWVYSEPGHGTTFKIYLPRTREAVVSSVAPPPDPSPRGTETVLLAEDDGPLRLLVRTALARLGYQILEAQSADEALLLCARFSGPIHLLLTDVVMPKVGGRELAERLAEQRPDTRVLFMSGYTDDTVVRHGVLAAGIAFLQKPVTPQSLARKVREVLDAPAGHPDGR